MCRLASSASWGKAGHHWSAIIIFPIFLELSAYFFLGLWFLLQFFYGSFTPTYLAAQRGGVAWWAHVGGFLIGILLLAVLMPHRVRHRWLRRWRPRGLSANCRGGWKTSL